MLVLLQEAANEVEAAGVGAGGVPTPPQAEKESANLPSSRPPPLPPHVWYDPSAADGRGAWRSGDSGGGSVGLTIEAALEAVCLPPAEPFLPLAVAIPLPYTLNLLPHTLYLIPRLLTFSPCCQPSSLSTPVLSSTSRLAQARCAFLDKGRVVLLSQPDVEQREDGSGAADPDPMAASPSSEARAALIAEAERKVCKHAPVPHTRRACLTPCAACECRAASSAMRTRHAQVQEYEAMADLCTMHAQSTRTVHAHNARAGARVRGWAAGLGKTVGGFWR